MLTTRVPSVFGLLYKAGRAISTPKHKSPVYWANRLYRDKLYEHLISRSFDAVVTSHLFPAEPKAGKPSAGKNAGHRY